MPYENLAPSSFWKLCRSDKTFRASELFATSFKLDQKDRIATIGSCFAQSIGKYLKASDAEFLEVEPAPCNMPSDVAKSYGYGLFSARYGNVYTARQFRQLVEDAITEKVHQVAIWQKGDRFFDALRPNVEPTGFAAWDEVMLHRVSHLRLVRKMISEMDVLILTLGLTETWIDDPTGIVFPTAPGTIAGKYDSSRHVFENMRYPAIYQDLTYTISLLREVNPNLRVVLTVSPVPLTATATGGHVLNATTYSKSVLRAVAQDVVGDYADVDYFPSYEIITGSPFKSAFYEGNLRSVTRAGVDNVMSIFFEAYPDLNKPIFSAIVNTEDEADMASNDELICEEAMLEALAKK